MPDLDWRLILGAAWGGGGVWGYGSVLRIRLRANRVHHDARTRRDLNSGLGLFITALGSGLATVFVLIGPEGASVRGFASAVALGSFLGAGLIMRTEAKGEAQEDPAIPEERP